MLPRLRSSNYDKLELIRPLYYINEAVIEDFTASNGIWPLNCACMVAAEKIASKRHEIKAMIKELKKSFKDVDKSIFNAAKNVNLDAIIGWQKKGLQFNYLDEYLEE